MRRRWRDRLRFVCTPNEDDWLVVPLPAAVGEPAAEPRADALSLRLRDAGEVEVHVTAAADGAQIASAAVVLAVEGSGVDSVLVKGHSCGPWRP